MVMLRIDQQAIFEKPDEGMKNHLKLLFVRAKVNDVFVNKVLIDGGAPVNLMPYSLLNKIGKYDTNHHDHKIVLSKYEGKNCHSWGAIQVDVAIGSSIKPTLFIVVPSKVNYNMLLGREWIHGVRVVPSTLHQRLTIWRDDGMVENIEVDQSYYLSEINHINYSSIINQCTKHVPRFTLVLQTINSN
jgi:hypothetical protein